jgi:hypothetical protein
MGRLRTGAQAAEGRPSLPTRSTVRSDPSGQHPLIGGSCVSTPSFSPRFGLVWCAPPAGQTIPSRHWPGARSDARLPFNSCRASDSPRCASTSGTPGASAGHTERRRGLLFLLATRAVHPKTRCWRSRVEAISISTLAATTKSLLFPGGRLLVVRERRGLTTTPTTEGKGGSGWAYANRTRGHAGSGALERRVQ